MSQVMCHDTHITDQGSQFSNKLWQMTWGEVGGRFSANIIAASITADVWPGWGWNQDNFCIRVCTGVEEDLSLRGLVPLYQVVNADFPLT